jgi:hypothetical protein
MMSHLLAQMGQCAPPKPEKAQWKQQLGWRTMRRVDRQHCDIMSHLAAARCRFACNFPPLRGYKRPVAGHISKPSLKGQWKQAHRDSAT